MTESNATQREWATVGSLRQAQYDNEHYPQIGFLDNVKVRFYLDHDKNVFVDGAYDPATNTCTKIQVGKVALTKSGKTAKVSIFRDTFTIQKERFDKLCAGEVSFATIAHPNPAAVPAAAAADAPAAL